MNPTLILQPQCQLLYKGLSHARQQLWFAQLRITLITSLERAIILGGFAVMAIGCAIVLNHLGWISVVWSRSLSIFSVAAIVFFFVGRMIPLLVTKPAMKDVAERLDLSTGGHNRVAIALEFSENAQPQNFTDRSPFESQAIVAGIRQLEIIRHDAPVMPTIRVNHRRNWTLLIVSLIMLISALSIPNRSGAVYPSGNDPVVLTYTTVASKSQAAAIPIQKTDSHIALTTGKSLTGQSAGKQGAVTGRSPADANSAAPGSGIATNFAKSGLPTDFSGERDNPTQSAAISSASGMEAQSKSAGHFNPQNADPTGLSRSAQTPSVSPELSSNQPKLNSGESNAQKSNSQSKGQSGTGAGKAPPLASDAGQGQSGDGPPGPPKKGGSANSSNGADAPGDGPTGRSSGQNPPKKSRGVAPLMLGTDMPDLLQGRQLAGPDQRAVLQVPPSRDPGEPAAAMAQDHRETAEHPVDPYRVPAQLQTIVGQYFQKFHQDSYELNSLPPPTVR